MAVLRAERPIPPERRVDWDLLDFNFDLNSIKPYLSEEGKRWLWALDQEEQRRISKWWKKNKPVTDEEIEQLVKRFR